MSNGPEWQKKEQTRPYGTFFCGPGAGRGSLRTAVQQGNADGGCVRVRKKGLSPKRKPLNLLERETGFEPATSTLARLHSTTELLSHTIERTQIRSVGDGGLYARVPYLSSPFFHPLLFSGSPFSPLGLNTGPLFCQFAHLLRQRRHAGIGNVP